MADPMQVAHNAAPALSWSIPLEKLALRSDEVHVWRASLKKSALQLDCLYQTLSTDEQKKAKRFRFRKDRDHYVAARGLLRAILGRYLGIDPWQLRFCYGPHGKPAMISENAAETLNFNVSHSHEFALYAITQGRELGVDIEHLQTHLPDEHLGELFFSPREIKALHALPTHLKPRAFLSCWTRKEAYLKGKGQGLMHRLNQIEVMVDPEDGVVLTNSGSTRHLSRWSIKELTPGADYVAALAVDGPDWQLRCWQWAGQ